MHPGKCISPQVLVDQFDKRVKNVLMRWKTKTLEGDVFETKSTCR
jgi:hypothetical protein